MESGTGRRAGAVRPPDRRSPPRPARNVPAVCGSWSYRTIHRSADAASSPMGDAVGPAGRPFSRHDHGEHHPRSARATTPRTCAAGARSSRYARYRSRSSRGRGRPGNPRAGAGTAVRRAAHRTRGVPARPRRPAPGPGARPGFRRRPASGLGPADGRAQPVGPPRVTEPGPLLPPRRRPLPRTPGRAGTAPVRTPGRAVRGGPGAVGGGTDGAGPSGTSLRPYGRDAPGTARKGKRPTARAEAGAGRGPKGTT